MSDTNAVEWSGIGLFDAASQKPDLARSGILSEDHDASYAFVASNGAKNRPCAATGFANSVTNSSAAS